VLQKPLRVAELETVLRKLQSVGQSPSAERLLTAIANDELVLEFQPVVCRKPKLLKKLEALVRWEHPGSGRIPPGDFLPLVESNTGVIDALTDWVVARRWKLTRCWPSWACGCLCRSTYPRRTCMT